MNSVAISSPPNGTLAAARLASICPDTTATPSWSLCRACFQPFVLASARSSSAALPIRIMRPKIYATLHAMAFMLLP